MRTVLCISTWMSVYMVELYSYVCRLVSFISWNVSSIFMIGRFYVILFYTFIAWLCTLYTKTELALTMRAAYISHIYLYVYIWYDVYVRTYIYKKSLSWALSNCITTKMFCIFILCDAAAVGSPRRSLRYSLIQKKLNIYP